jgi:hypothetical protein
MTTQRMTVSRESFTRQVLPDPHADASYLEQDEFEDRLEQYRAGCFGFVGVRASAELHIPHGSAFIIQHIETPGLWGIEDDSGDDYLESVFQEECNTLASMLEAMGIEVVA